jgi:hypothetical protein
MDDDFAFGSVWAADSTAPPAFSSSTSFSASSSPSASFDDDGFEDFGQAQQVAAGDAAGDEDFGDFGDFEDTGGGFEEGNAFDGQRSFPGPSSRTHPDYTALNIDPMPSRSELQDAIDAILGPLWENDDLSGVLNNEGIREVGGVNQVLITQERYGASHLHTGSALMS